MNRFLILGAWLSLVASPACAAETGVAQLGEDVRWVFAGFLYGFVMCEIATRFARLFLGWKQSRPDQLATVLHLGLASVVVLTSWMGWSLAIAHGVYPKPHTIFEIGTLLFVVDVALVTCYYALVLGIEVHSDGSARLPTLRHVLFWTAIIFGGYLAWDILAAIANPQPDWRHAGVSGACLVLSAVAFRMLKDIKPKVHDAWPIYFATVALISLFLAFRAGKASLVPELDHLRFVALPLLVLFLVLAGAARLRNR